MNPQPTIADTVLVSPQAQPIETKKHALARRLVDNALRPDEALELDKVRQILAHEAAGKIGKQIFPLLGFTSLGNYRGFLRSQKYRLYRRFLMETARQTDSLPDTDRQQRRSAMRRRFDDHDQDALDYVAYAFRRHRQASVKDKIQAGDFLDPDRAERAAKMVATAQGWLDPIPQHVKPKDLTPGVIQAQMAAVRSADQREMVVRVTTPGGETVEVGLREKQGEEIG